MQKFDFTTCRYNINGVCNLLSDETVQQPCIEGPCPATNEDFIKKDIKENEK